MKVPVRFSIEDAFDELVAQFRWHLREGDVELTQSEKQRGEDALHELSRVIAALKLRHALK